MATSDTSRNADRLRTVFSTLLRQLPAPDREILLAGHVEDLQRSVDAALEIIGGGAVGGPSQPSGRRLRSSPARTRPVAPTAARGAVAVDSTSDDAGTVPAAIRAVLAGEAQGLLPRAIMAGIEVLRPGTIDHSVTSALHSMLKRGELAREGFHKNYRYILVASPARPTNTTAARGPDDDGPRGGETH